MSRIFFKKYKIVKIPKNIILCPQLLFFLKELKKSKKLLQFLQKCDNIKGYENYVIQIRFAIICFGGVDNMLTAWEWIISILLMVVAIVMIIIVLFQQSDDEGLSGAIGGSSSAYDSYLGKNESRTTSAKLARFTKMLAAVFFVFVMVLDIIILVNK